MNGNSIERINTIKSQIRSISEPTFPNPIWADVDAWFARATPVIRNDWPRFYDDFQTSIAKPDRSREVTMRTVGASEFNQQQERNEWERDRQDRINVITNFDNFLDGLLSLAHESPTFGARENAIFICNRFPILARQLRTRERSKEPLIIEDEYDVQYLLLAILRLHFDDVRPEAWTPDYAGGGSRMDFFDQG